MPHPLVLQLRFARSEFQRALAGLSAEDACRRIMPMNSISWNVGHLAWQEQRYWLIGAQDKLILPEVNELFAYRAPACVPQLDEVQANWRTITEAADPWLDTLTTEKLQEPAIFNGKPTGTTYGSRLLRTIYHYWYHTGENSAIRQALGHTRLPDFVGSIDTEAPYLPE
jgi:uncharacterized damage-inducible protein DinB